MSAQGKDDRGFKKSFWIIHSGCGHREIIECRGLLFSVMLAAPAGSSADLTAPAGWSFQLGNSDGIALACLSFTVTIFSLLYIGSHFNENTIRYDTITHFLN